MAAAAARWELTIRKQVAWAISPLTRLPPGIRRTAAGRHFIGGRDDRDLVVGGRDPRTVRWPLALGSGSISPYACYSAARELGGASGRWPALPATGWQWDVDPRSNELLQALQPGLSLHGGRGRCFRSGRQPAMTDCRDHDLFDWVGPAGDIPAWRIICPHDTQLPYRTSFCTMGRIDGNSARGGRHNLRQFIRSARLAGSLDPRSIQPSFCASASSLTMPAGRRHSPVNTAIRNRKTLREACDRSDRT